MVEVTDDQVPDDVLLMDTAFNAIDDYIEFTDDINMVDNIIRYCEEKKLYNPAK